ncbi:arylamine N-acetyltransferase [Colwellia sp. D2M02]|uniref:arylamine N-acetyltransferase n=1 Tax=Colwellia sp. D2M02 TaxID=2841562 RepID=UPI001C088389|nr:arylamine N-acetyltransferase [Colwellia sp. D2M02]MBU2894968.1 arylamine N-acetyltransferase [Colwellia sp. D2M02]
MLEPDKTLLCTLRRQFETFPFHNLGQLLAKETCIGGTCFDQALKLKHDLIKLGYEASIHEAIVCLTGDKSHRLVKVENSKNISFLDAGSGWPTLYQAHSRQKQYISQVASIQFRITKKSNNLLIERYDEVSWREMNRISIIPQQEAVIIAKYKRRYLQPLPYDNELRFCWLEQQKFHRITGSTLRVFESNKETKRVNLSSTDIVKHVNNFFPELVSDLSLYLERFQ